MSIPHRLKCAETWASNQETSSAVDLPGLRVWVHSTPFGPGEAAGEVHYVSVCPSCMLSRIALADVSGHGRAVASLGAKLRELMQTYLTALEQASLMRDLNEAVIGELDGVHYATMVAAGFHARRGLLVMTNAGHPPALLNHNGKIEPISATGLPLGMFPNQEFSVQTATLAPGEFLLLYTDGVSEALNTADEEYGTERLIGFATASQSLPAKQLVDGCLSDVSTFRRGASRVDDITVLGIRRT